MISEPDGFSALAIELLSERYTVIKGPFTRTDLASELADADALFVRLGHRIDAELLAQASQLKFIISPTTGVNHIDGDVANTNGVQLITLQGEEQLLADIFSTAELTWGLLLSLSRRIGSAHNSVVNGLWDRDQFRGSDLRRKTIGIIGLGRLGKMVATYAQAFGMHTCYFDPLVKSESHDKCHSLESLCATADVVTLHVNSTAQNKRLFNQACFHAMKPSALFINTSRGELVDETALYNALCEERIAGAAIDVLCEENDPRNMSSRLLRRYAEHHQNLIITPHIGGATRDSMQRTEMHLAKKLMVLASQ